MKVGGVKRGTGGPGVGWGGGGVVQKRKKRGLRKDRKKRRWRKEEGVSGGKQRKRDRKGV
jgi:hypothetical protein